ncbi:hypothetical protein B484DRAFT_464385 [Ochromonadaceae sp. CCMP2298]|nr:hypothetical protein B484DRAFT_464385 [Ochromonadaceae sp. CCMP2298]
MFNEWDTDPDIPFFTGYYSTSPPQRGVFAINDSGLIPTPLIPFHGLNLYSLKKQGEAVDRLMKCVEDSSFADAASCGVTTKLIYSSESQEYNTGHDTDLTIVNSQRSVPIVVGDKNHHEFMGLIGTQYSWGPTLSRIFSKSVSGIDIVVKYGGSTFTCRINEGLAEIIGGSEVEGYGDVAGKRFAKYKVFVPNALSDSQFKIESDEKVLRNLISNSLKFTHIGGTVTVTAEYDSDGLESAIIQQAPRILLDNPRAGAVRITVQDDGAGLSPAQVGDICKEGVQFNANTLQAGGGSGLGLFIGKGIVEQLGGTMRVSSEGLGKGAQFVIELPLFKSDDPTPSVSEVQQEDAIMLLVPLVPVNKYLLVVDDATSNRKLLVRILKNKGYLCSEAGDGQQALDVYRQMCVDGTPPCAVLMDYEMPVMNGPTATKQLRETGCGSYIVGVTGNVMQADIDVFIQHGANAVLAKPLRVEIFESMVRTILCNHSSGTAQRLEWTFHPLILS